MYVSRLTIDNIRVLKQQRLALEPGASLFYGRNGSGKTSLLEAISLLATGRSFRTHLARPLIAHGEDSALVQVRLMRGAMQHALGVRKPRSGSAELRLDGQNASSQAELAALLPVVVLDAASTGLIEGAPDQRRRFLDGTVFHVEHQFLMVWRRYQRALRQRNAGLRRGTLSADKAWVEELVLAGEALTATRLRVGAELRSVYREVASALSPALTGVDLSLRRGWDKSLSLKEALERSEATDQAQGFTHVGPHRAEIKLSVDGKPAAEVLSRGQMKLATLALKMAQARQIESTGQGSPVILADDMAAELDREHASAVYCLLAESGAQVLMTAVSPAEVRTLWPTTELKLFHVEQGIIQPD